MAKTLIDIRELSARLQIAAGTLYNWVSQARHGRGPFRSGERQMFKKIGRCLRFDWDEIEEKLLSKSGQKG